MYQVHFRKSHRIQLSEPSAKNTAHQCDASRNKIASIAGIEGLVIFAPAGGASRSPSMNPGLSGETRHQVVITWVRGTCWLFTNGSSPRSHGPVSDSRRLAVVSMDASSVVVMSESDSS